MVAEEVGNNELFSREVKSVDDKYIATQLQKFNVSDSAIEELRNNFFALKIAGVEDKEGYQSVRVARLTMRNYRIDVEKRRKELTEDALKYQRAVNNEAKRITTMLEPIEQYLIEKEQHYNEENERIKREKEEAEARVLQLKVDELTKLGFCLVYMIPGVCYQCDYMSETISLVELKTMPDSIFKMFVDKCAKAYELKAKECALAQEKKAREEAELKAEHDRLIQLRKEQEAEAYRLDQIAKQQADQARILKEEKERIDKIKVDNERTEKEMYEHLDKESLKEDKVSDEMLLEILYAEEKHVVLRDIKINAETILDYCKKYNLTLVANEKMFNILKCLDEEIDNIIQDFIRGIIIRETRGRKC